MDLSMYVEAAVAKLKKSAVRISGKIPCDTTNQNGAYNLSNGGGWTDSFYVGMLHLAYSYTKDCFFADASEQYRSFFEERAENSKDICEAKGYLMLDHDIGFIYSLSMVADYKLHQSPQSRLTALRAADVLCGRFVENGQYILAWNEWEWDTPEFREEKKGKMIIDSMMNLPLLLWAYEETADEKYRKVAVNHAETIKKYIIRSDFSTYHQFNFHPDTGAPIKGVTGQGFDDCSCWARGQAWAIYGFSLLYGYTGNQEYLHLAMKLGDYFMEHLTIFDLPEWDFLLSKDVPIRPWDSSASAIAACGMLQIGSQLADSNPQESNFFLTNGERLICALNHYCSTIHTVDCEALLLHGTGGPAYSKQEPSKIRGGTDVPLIFGDYFYLEALLRLVQQEEFMSFF